VGRLGGKGWEEGRGNGEGILSWTVLRAETSQPRACMMNVAMVLPTYLLLVRRNGCRGLGSFVRGGADPYTT